MLFEVKGWNLSAPLVTQTEGSLVNKNDNPKGNDSKVGRSSGSKSSERKRKRGITGKYGGDGLKSASDAALMSADTIGKLWKRHAEKEGKKGTGTGTEIGGKVDEKKRRRRKRMKLDELGKDQGKMRIEHGRRDGILKDADGGSVQNDDGDKNGRDMRKRNRESTGTNTSKAERRKERELLNVNGKPTTPAEKGKVQLPNDEAVPAETTAAAAAQSEAQSSIKLTPLQNQMREKLISARFRRLNETLYTSPSAEAVKLFQTQPDLFHEYHAGFRQQVAAWPANPVDGFVSAVLTRGRVESADQKRRTQHKQNGKNKKRKRTKDEQGPETGEQEKEQAGLQPLPRTRGTCTIFDIGCGTAPFARALQSHMSRLRLSIRSFDLLADSSDSAAASPSAPVRIEQADMCALPVANGTADVAILCLALMGTNWPEAIDDAWRVLRWKGELWIAETKSRFAHATVTSRGIKTTGAGTSIGTGGSIGRRKVGVVTNSNTKAQRSKVGGKFANEKDENEDENANDNDYNNAEDEDTLGTSISPPFASASATATATATTVITPETSHLIPFLTVLQKRGFVLARNDPCDDDDDNKNNKNNNNNDNDYDTFDTNTSTNILISPPLYSSSSSPPSKSVSALDTSNKMFVTMRLVKATMPVRGKNSSERKQHDVQNWRNNNNNKQAPKGRRARGKWKTVVVSADDDRNKNKDNGDYDDDDDDAKVLKACVYKLR